MGCVTKLKLMKVLNTMHKIGSCLIKHNLIVKTKIRPHAASPPIPCYNRPIKNCIKTNNNKNPR